MPESVNAIYELTNSASLLEIIGENLRQIRRARNEKITVVAQSLKVNQSVISQIENGKYKCLSLELLVKIADYYEEEFYDIIKLKK